jgi:hypothetical protein
MVRTAVRLPVMDEAEFFLFFFPKFVFPLPPKKGVFLALRRTRCVSPRGEHRAAPSMTLHLARNVFIINFASGERQVCDVCTTHGVFARWARRQS